MYIPFCSILLLLHSSLAAKKGGNADNDETIFSSSSTYTLNVEHAFGVNKDFTPKGTIVFKVGHRTTTAAFSRETKLSLEEVEKLQELALKDGFYRIKAGVKLINSYADEKEKSAEISKKYVSTFAKACHLWGSNLQEKIIVAIDDNGNVIGVSLMSPKHECPTRETLKPLTSHIFNSTIQIHAQVAGATPDTQSFVKKMEKEQAEQAAGKGKENKSFLAKYWMYIVPIFLVLMLSSQAEPQEGGNGGGGGGGN